MNKDVKHILIVDDNEDICEVVTLILVKAGYDAHAVGHFEPFSNGNTPDLILLDIKMGAQDGREVCRNLKSHKETHDIPVIIFSASPDVKDQAEKAGADDFISKPFEIKELLGKIEHLSQAA